MLKGILGKKKLFHMNNYSISCKTRFFSQPFAVEMNYSCERDKLTQIASLLMKATALITEKRPQ